MLTGSRAGIALLPLVTLIAAFTWQPRWRRPGAIAAAAVAALAPLLAVAVLQTQDTALRNVAARFNTEPDARIELWRTTLVAIHRVWPVGSGTGTFKPVFIAAEPLAAVDPTRPVRAHNDYLEFVLEGGIVAVAVLGGGIALLGVAWHRALRQAPPRDQPTLGFVATALLVVGLHSLVDYPLRSMALAYLTATAVGMLLAIARDPAERGSGETTQS